MTGVRFWGDAAKIRSKYIYHRDVDPNGRVGRVRFPRVSAMERIILARKLLRFRYCLETTRLFKRNSFKKLQLPFHENLRRRVSRKKEHSTCKHRKLRKENDPISEEPSPATVEGTVSDLNVPKVDLELELKQCKLWKKRILKALNSQEVLEILANGRLFSELRRPSVLTTTLESMQIAIHNHDWALAFKCGEGLADLRRRNFNSGSWLLWNGGFLALSNAYKNDVNRVLDFAHHARSALGAYPRRLGIEVGTWLTQKGYFRRGLDLINEWHGKWGKGIVFKRKVYRNPKRYQVDLVAVLFEAAYSYACWKRGVELLARGEYHGDRIGVRRVGEAALLLFESLLDLAEKADADVTIFIEQLIELTMEFKTEFVAREVFLALVIKHERNFVLEEMYLNFINKYFPFLEEENELFNQRRKFYNFRKLEDETNVFKLRSWKRKKLEANHMLTFKKRPVPQFSI